MSEKDFWDLSQYVEHKKQTSFQNRRTIETISVSLGEQNKDTRTEKIPSRTENPAQAPQEVREYSYDSGLIRKMSIKKWARVIDRFELFRKQAKALFSEQPVETEYVKFVSYMPMFEQMSKAQISFYIYWKSQIRKGIYLTVESSYIFLLMYEIVNLPDCYSAEEGADMFVRLMENYGRSYPYIYKNIGECLIDWCLLRKIKVPSMPISVLDKVISAVSLPELFYNDLEIPQELLYKYSLYSYKDNKVYKSYPDKEKWDQLISEGALVGVRKILNDASIMEKLTYSHMVRDCFQSAPVASCSKYWVSLEYISLTRNVTLKTLIGHCFKVSENEVRDILGVRNAVKMPYLPAQIIDAIKEYYATNYPERIGRQKKTEEDESYMSLYEPENKEADIQTAEIIEEKAWETAVKLGAESEEEEPETKVEISEPVYISQDSYSVLLDSLEGRYAEAVMAALNHGFADYCRKCGIMAMEAERIINEKSMELTGDILIESGEILEDYLEDISKAIKERG